MASVRWGLVLFSARVACLFRFPENDPSPHCSQKSIFSKYSPLTQLIELNIQAAILETRNHSTTQSVNPIKLITFKDTRTFTHSEV